MQEWWEKSRHFAVPTKENAFRPRLLGKSWLVFFFALALALEGFLVSGLAARQSDTFLTVAPQSAGASVAAAQQTQTLVREFIRIVSDPKVVDSLLGGVGGLLLILVALAFFFHMDVQSHEAIAGGLVVAALALACLAANAHFLSPDAPQSAAGISALAP